MNEVKALAASLAEIKTVDDEARTIEGYGAVFDNIDSYGDVIVKGAFAKTIEQHLIAGTMPKMLLQHDAFTALPIGKWTEMQETDHGLFLKGKLFNTTAGRDTHEVLREGGVDGLSIGFRPVEFALRAKPTDAKRTLKVVDLLEVSVVTFPANSKAKVTNVKSADQIVTLRDLEDLLRSQGCSKSEAILIASRFESRSEADERREAEDVIRAAHALMQSLRAS